MIAGLTRRIRRLHHGRGMRKLLRDRMAMGALVVIAVYTLLALAVGVFGLFTREQAFERVAPSNLPGFWLEVDREKRLEDAEFLFEFVGGALESERPAEALADLRMGLLRPAPEPPEVLSEKVERCRALYDALAVEPDLDAVPDIDRKLDELEAAAWELYAPLSGFDALRQKLRLMLGTDRQGRSILIRGLYSVKVSILIGAISALLAVFVGTLLGGLAGFFGGWVDHLVVWLYSIFSSIPWIVLLMVLAAMFTGSRYEGTLMPVYAAFGISFWISPCRVIRGEVMKLKELEYVQAATAIGFGRLRILSRHVIPNTAHLMFINFSLLFIGAIKAEVILSFLNLGVKDEPSWGVMINQAREEVLNGFFWQIGTATALMVVLVLAFNVLSDALQDAFDPKHVS